MKSLRRFSDAMLFEKLRLQEAEFFEWLQGMALITGMRMCGACGEKVKCHKVGVKKFCACP